MTRALPAGLPERFWREACAARHRLLAVDFDGTLSPFVVDPARARPDPRALAALERIVAAGRTRVAVLSGRPAAEVAARLGGLPLTVVGEHGWEVRDPHGGQPRPPLPPDLAARLDEAAAVALAPARIERKRTAVVVHLRGLPAAEARRARAAARRQLARRAADGRLALRPIAAGLELRAAGRDKGTALAELAAEAGGSPFVVALGDDDTDEDAFRAARRLGGWGILVGRDRATAARARLASLAAVARFLAGWCERVDGAPPAAAPDAAGDRSR